MAYSPITDRLSPEQRLMEVAKLLAKAFYRLRHQDTFCTKSARSDHNLQKTLAFAAQSSVHKGAGKYPTDGLTDNKEPV